jgi:glycosyltransferase involved in cell wall biosynthesis
MVSTEYPPMIGGVGRYTEHLVKSLRNLGMDILVVSNDNGNGEFKGISPSNVQNSKVLLNIVNEIKPDIVHIQFEPILYGLIIDSSKKVKSKTYIDSFYRECKVPIVTTYHTIVTFKQWMKMGKLVKKTGRTKQLGIPLRLLIKFWKYSLGYSAFQKINREKLALSKANIVFSYYMRSLIGNGTVIYHGAEPHSNKESGNNTLSRKISNSNIDNTSISKKNARLYFSLPQESKIALALGFKTVSKGWDILRRITIPKGWKIVINSSKRSYYTENYDIDETLRIQKDIIDLQKGFLSEEELSKLFFSADAVLLPYKLTAGSGVMFDGLAHGVPFIATDLGFFKEFSSQGLGITTKRTANNFSNAIKKLDNDYDSYINKIEKFKERISWTSVAEQHRSLYNKIKPT